MVKMDGKLKDQSLFAWIKQHPGITYLIMNLVIYTPPAFENLEVSSGTMILQPFERYSGKGGFVTDGYYLKLKLDDQSHLMLKCYLMNFREAPCYRESVNKEPSFKSDLAFQKVTVRWLPLNDRDKFDGIVYQIEQDNVPLINFDSFVERYKTDYERVTGNKASGLK